MSSRVSAHIRSNVVGYVSLYVALGGVAWAAGQVGAGDIKDNAVHSNHIKNGQVKSGDLGTNAVNSGKVADGSLSGADLASNSVGAQQVDESSLDPSVLQKRVTGTCTAGQVVSAVTRTAASAASAAAARHRAPQAEI